MRADLLLARRGLVSSRARARAAILAGHVRCAGAPVEKPGQMLAVDADLDISPPASSYVSRGGAKLAAACTYFSVDFDGLCVLDLGASTGGFTDVALQQGAARVYAVDVGHGQLHDSLRRDPRVISLEGVNGRDLGRPLIPEPLDAVVCDTSFISLKKVLPPALDLCRAGAWLVALIKPQFEAGRDHVGKGGIVRDCRVHERVCTDIAAWLAARPVWQVRGVMPSPIPGAGGNAEFLIAARKTSAAERC